MGQKKLQMSFYAARKYEQQNGEFCNNLILNMGATELGAMLMPLKEEEANNVRKFCRHVAKTKIGKYFIY